MVKFDDMINQGKFTGEYTITGLDALTVMVKLEHLPPKDTRANYLRLISSSDPLRAFDQCLDCMIRNFSARVGDDGRLLIIDKMKRGRLVVVSLEPYAPGEYCARCASHMQFVSLADRILGEPR